MSDQLEAQTFQDVIALNELKEGEMFPLSVRGQPIVLVRQGDEVRAFSGRCPHRSAPMEQGAYCKSSVHGDVLVCPWHKAVFSAETGRLVEPVAFGHLSRYPVAVAEGRVLVGTVPLPVPKAEERRLEETVLIIGGGAAGVSAAYTLREEGFAGGITIIGDEAGLPYDRTALSKTVLVSDSERASAPSLMSERDYTKYRIERVEGRVQALDMANRLAVLEDGQTLTANHIIVATGGRARRPDLPGINLKGVLSLHSQEDARLIAEAITPDQAIVLIGGGFIGLEVASSLRQKGVGVTIVTPEVIPLEEQLGREIGMRLLQLHEDNSVAFVNDAGITSIYGEEHVEGVELDDGTRLPCTNVLVAVGVKPQCDFIDPAIANGPEGSLPVDEGMHILSDGQSGDIFPGIYAAGDVCSMARNGKFWRVEHWRHAEIQGRFAAFSILGRAPRAIPMPWFWTQQFGRRIEYLGWGERFDHVILTGDLRDFNFLATYSHRGRVVGLSGAGHPSEMSRAAVDFRRFLLEYRGTTTV